MIKNNKYEIPFDEHGNQQHYPEPGYRPTPEGGYHRFEPTWKPNEEFEDTLRYSCFRRGRSAAYFVFQTSDGKERVVFLTDFEDMVPHMCGGLIRGRFMYRKRGANYGTRLVEAIK